MWQLLLDSEGIEIGNKIKVELESGQTVTMTLMSYNAKKITLRSSRGSTVKYSPETLESLDEGDEYENKYADSQIIGKK